MRRTSPKIKVAVTRVPLRKAAITPAIHAVSAIRTTSVVVEPVVASRRAFPAWIDANDQAVSFSATTATAPTAVTSRVRDSLVLRVVSRAKPVTKKVSHGPGAR